MCVVVVLGLSRHSSLLCVFPAFLYAGVDLGFEKVVRCCVRGCWIRILDLEKFEKGAGITNDLPKSGMCNHGGLLLI